MIKRLQEENNLLKKKIEELENLIVFQDYRLENCIREVKNEIKR